MVKDNIRSIREQLPNNVKLVVVSKFRPVEQLREAYDAGERVFAESRPQEFAAKVPALPGDIQWHFIGHLQTNKLRSVVPHAALIHSVDSLHLLDAIEKFCEAGAMESNVLLEVHIGAEETKQGFSPKALDEALSHAEQCCPRVHVRGLMGMASHTEDTLRIEQDFQLLRRLFDGLKPSHPCLEELSMGMSGDWKIAVSCGSTMVRIGTAVFNASLTI